MELHCKEVIGANVYMTDYVYDANMQLKTYTEQQNAYPPVSVTYTFTNGDNTLSTSAGSGDTLTYDTTKLAVFGNMDHFNQLLNQGAMYIKNKHLLISARHGGYVVYSYTFNSDGNIASISISVNGVKSGKFVYTYECK